ncbi:hypothetical protein vseg_017842 [Gypsophila vaccaria]
MTSLVEMNNSNDGINNTNNPGYDAKHEDDDDMTADELEVASILLDLPYLIQLSNNNNNNNSNNKWSKCNGKNSSKFPIWVSKKRRTVLDLPPSPPWSPSGVKLMEQVSSPSSPLCLSTTQQTSLQPHKRKHSPSSTTTATALEIEGVQNLWKKVKYENQQLKTEADDDETQRKGTVVEEVAERSVGISDEKEQHCAPSIAQPRGDIQSETGRPRRGLDIDLNMPALEMEEEEEELERETIRKSDEAEAKAGAEIETETETEMMTTTTITMRKNTNTRRQGKKEASVEQSNAEICRIRRQERSRKMKLKIPRTSVVPPH